MHFYMQKCLTATDPGSYAGAVSRTLVEQVRGDLGVSRRLFARLTGYSERAIAAWEAGRELSEASRTRMLETRRLEKALAKVMKPSAIAAWLEQPNRAFRGLKPLEVIERGEVDRIWRMVFELEAGNPG